MERRVHIVGLSGHGKTTLVKELIPELTRRGLRVGSVKHTPHSYPIDQEGKDSRVHALAGAQPAAVICGANAGIFLSATTQSPDSEWWVTALAPSYSSCDLVIVEGCKTAKTAPIIEVWNSELAPQPLMVPGTCAIILRGELPKDIPAPLPPSSSCSPWLGIIPRTDLSAIADAVIKLSKL